MNCTVLKWSRYKVRHMVLFWELQFWMLIVFAALSEVIKSISCVLCGLVHWNGPGKVGRIFSGPSGARPSTIFFSCRAGPGACMQCLKPGSHAPQIRDCWYKKVSSLNYVKWKKKSKREVTGALLKIYFVDIFQIPFSVSGYIFTKLGPTLKIVSPIYSL